MNRRSLLQIFSVGSVAAMGVQFVPRMQDDVVAFEDVDADVAELARSIEYIQTPAPSVSSFRDAFESVPSAPTKLRGADLTHYLSKMKNFERAHREDVFLAPEKLQTLVATFNRLDRVQTLVGHGNFNVLGLDEMLKFSRRYRSVGTFAKDEVDFLAEIFHENASRYGFYGDKVTTEITDAIAVRDRYKVPYTGHFLYRGDPLALYKKVRKDLGGNVTLTSGIRSIVKQSYLFLAKTIRAKGNLSRASRSLAPPGHSFHGTGDFDVGKVGFGRKNFTQEFAKTREYQRLVDLGYVDMRYPMHNLLGVRYEPWHIKVTGTKLRGTKVMGTNVT